MGVVERKEREFLRREQEILDAARALFGTDRWQSVTVEEIAERAEIGKGTVYKHFASKDEIYAKLVAEFQERTLARLEAIDARLPVMTRLREIIRIIWEQHRDAVDYQPLLQYCQREGFRHTLPGPAQEELVAQKARFDGAIFRVLEDGIREGILPAKSPQALVLGPTAALTGATRMICECIQQEQEPGQFLEEITNFILAGMLYQEWLADEGLDGQIVTRRAEEEHRELEKELEREAASYRPES